MLFYLFIVLFFKELGDVLGIDPVAGPLVVLNCFNEKEVTGCNESFVEAYAKTEGGKTDESSDKPDTLIYLFTQRNRDNPEPLHKCGGKLPENTNYKCKRKTKIFIHGYLGCQCDYAAMREVKDQLLHRGDYNVILIDWCWGSGLDYGAASANARIVGKQIAFLIRNIVRQTGASLIKFHLLGISLGAHAAGFAGQCFKNEKKKIGRITGMDPAMPGFAVEDIDQRLDKTDAEWVDVIHTDAGPCLPKLGDPRIIGHADFFVNGGSVQLSCISHNVESILKGDVLLVSLVVALDGCFHMQSLEYFKVSINPCDCQFIGIECESYEDYSSGKCRDCGEDGSKCAVMGMDWDRFPRSKDSRAYYLDTSLFCPYCDNSGININGFSKLQEKCTPKRHCFNPERKSGGNSSTLAIQPKSTEKHIS